MSNHYPESTASDPIYMYEAEKVYKEAEKMSTEAEEVKTGTE